MGKTSLMKVIGVSWFNSIFMRITATFVAILLPLYLLGIAIYDWALTSVRNEITGSMISQVNYYMDSLEKEIQRIKYLEYDLINDLYLNRLAAIPRSMDDIDRIQAILILQNRLEALRSSSQYISNITVYIPSIGRIVTDRHVDALDEAQFLAYTDYYQAEYYKATNLIQYWLDRPVMLMVSPYMDNSTGKPMYLFVLDLDRQAFENALFQFDKYPGSGSFLINTQTKANIATANINEDVEGRIIEHLAGEQQGVLAADRRSGQEAGMYIYSSSDVLGMTLAMYVPDKVVFAPMRQYRYWFFLFTAVAAAIIAIYSLSMRRFIHKPLMHLVGAFEHVEEGNLQIAIEHRHNDEFRYLYRRFNAMVENLSTLIQQVYTMKILTQKAELKQLQSQINPHFLYNSFFILHRRIKGGDYDNAIAFSHQLGNYFRFITRNADDEVVLAQEVEHARIYADIQTIRFASRMRSEFEELPDELRPLIVPRLILQPLIENAFEHGLENKASGGLLRIGYRRAGNLLVVAVEDNGDDLTDGELARLQAALGDSDGRHESTGVINIHRRLRLKFGGRCGAAVSRSPLGGLRVELTIDTSGGNGNG